MLSFRSLSTVFLGRFMPFRWPLFAAFRRTAKSGGKRPAKRHKAAQKDSRKRPKRQHKDVVLEPKNLSGAILFAISTLLKEVVLRMWF